MALKDDVKKVLADLQNAVVAASGRIGDLGLSVDEIEVDLQTAITSEVGGELDLKVVKLGGGVAREHVNTVSVAFQPTEAVPAAGWDDDLTAALETIERAISSIGSDFSLVSSSVEIVFTISLDGKINVVVGGEASRAETHKARIKLVPA